MRSEKPNGDLGSSALLTEAMLECSKHLKTHDIPGFCSSASIHTLEVTGLSPPENLCLYCKQTNDYNLSNAPMSIHVMLFMFFTG